MQLPKVKISANGEIAPRNRTQFAAQVGVKRSSIPAVIGRWQVNNDMYGIIEVRDTETGKIFCSGGSRRSAIQRWIEMYAIALRKRAAQPEAA